MTHFRQAACLSSFVMVTDKQTITGLLYFSTIVEHIVVCISYSALSRSETFILCLQPKMQNTISFEGVSNHKSQIRSICMCFCFVFWCCFSVVLGHFLMLMFHPWVSVFYILMAIVCWNVPSDYNALWWHHSLSFVLLWGISFTDPDKICMYDNWITVKPQSWELNNLCHYYTCWKSEIQDTLIIWSAAISRRLLARRLTLMVFKLLLCLWIAKFPFRFSGVHIRVFNVIIDKCKLDL